MIELTQDGSKERLEPQIRQVLNLLHREATNVRHYENIKYLHVRGITDSSSVNRLLNQFYQTGKLQIISNVGSVITLVDAGDIYANNFGTTNFDIFSIYLTNYCSLLALKKLLESGKSYESLKADPSLIQADLTPIREAFLPASVKKWRNKVAAHYAAANPDSQDNLATLMSSISTLPAYNSPYYSVGETKFSVGGKQSQLKPWALTEVYEELITKIDGLKDIPPLIAHTQ